MTGNRRNTTSPFRALVRAGLLILALFAVLFLFRIQLLTHLASLLVVDDAPPGGDIIYLLNGDVETRPFHAARLFREGRAGRIVIPRQEDEPATKAGILPNMTDAAVRIMRKLGVPPERIIVIPVPGGVTSTRDEAAVLRRYVDAHGTKRVILVTSAFHTRRALWIMKKQLDGSPALVLSSPAADYGFDTTNWWQGERGLISFTNEYIKLFYYYAKYR